AVYMASANLAFSAGSGLAVLLESWMGYGGMYVLCGLMNLGFLFLWPLFSLEQHQKRVNILEEAFQT
ncbi:MAG: hypothetical protein OEZ23_05280, partial [Gammaproteobacteria bacterium]|nr:hypothetical protein [Gammaproteobacteria bacterium]